MSRLRFGIGMALVAFAPGVGRGEAPAKAKPDLPAVNLQVVHTSRLDRWFARWLFSPSMIDGGWPLLIDLSKPIKPDGGKVTADPIVRGQKRGLVILGKCLVDC